MFDWVLNTVNTPLNTIRNFFSWRFHIKVNDFFKKFFSMINFSYQYLQEAKAYLKPNQTYIMELFRNFVYAKFTRKHLCWSLFLTKLQTGLYPQSSRSEVFCEEIVLKICNFNLHQVFISVYYSKIYLFLFSKLPMVHWKHEFLETMQPHWGFIYYRKLFFTLSLKKIVISLYDCINNI